MSKDNFDFENDFQETPKKKSYADLDLGLDFDLSFLDDIDESVLDLEPVEVKAPPVKKPAPSKKEAAAKKPAAQEGAAKKTVSSKKPATVQKDASVHRNAPAKKAAAKDPAAEAPVKKASAKKQTAPQEEPVKAKKQKKGPRLGGVIFYTLYFMFILIFFVATYIGLQWLHGWLADYELAQPTVKAEQVFQEVFTDPDWGALYDSAGAQDSPYEGKEEYVAYMENKVGDTPLTYLETSAGLSGGKKYVVRLGEEKVATFTLVDRNKVGAVSLENLENITDIPDWVLGSVEVFFEREEVYNIVILDGHTAYVNDVPLDDSFTIQIATTVAEKYLPEGTTGASMCTQQVTGLMEVPTVTVFDKNGNQMEVSYDEATRTFTEKTESNTMSDEEKNVALEAAKTNCLWMIEELKDRGTVAKYYDPSCEPYNTIVKTTELWMQNHNGYQFADEQVTDYARYADDMFSVRVSMVLKVTRTDGSVKDYDFAKSLFFHKNDAGNWLVFNWTNVDVSEPVGKVRLTFMQGDTQITSDFFSTDSEEIVTPKITVADGEVFTGWITISENEDGTTVYNLEFQPDETGIVAIPSGTTLKPMTLYALVQNASEVQAITEVPAETAAETAAAETVPTETAPAETTLGA